MKVFTKIVLLGSGLLATVTAMAHAGHGNSETGLWHYLTEPAHLFGSIAVVVGLAGIVLLLLRLRRQYH
jgi:hypothetical protein